MTRTFVENSRQEESNDWRQRRSVTWLWYWTMPATMLLRANDPLGRKFTFISPVKQLWKGWFKLLKYQQISQHHKNKFIQTYRFQEWHGAISFVLTEALRSTHRVKRQLHFKFSLSYKRNTDSLYGYCWMCWCSVPRTNFYSDLGYHDVHSLIFYVYLSFPHDVH